MEKEKVPIIKNGRCVLWDECENAGTITCYDSSTNECFWEIIYGD